MKLIVGLGNPGRRYQSTPHNVGYEAVEELARRHGMRWSPAKRLEAQCAEGKVEGEACLLVKPTTYMNASGEAIAPLIRGRKMDPRQDLLVVLDDVALPFGRLRMRPGGSSGGHKGLQSIIDRLHTQDFTRLRCGIAAGDLPPGMDLAGFVLAHWPKAFRPQVDRLIAQAANAADLWMTERDLARAMNRVNGGSKNAE